MAQVNVAYDDLLLAHLDALAATRGLPRPDLLRAIAEEAVRANEQGRALFEQPDAPIDPETAILLATKVEGLSIDFDRLMRSVDRREKRMLERFDATEEANRTAFERVQANMVDRFVEGSAPFTSMLAELRADNRKLHEDMIEAARSPASIDEIKKELAVISSRYQEVRPVYNLHLFREIDLNAWGWGVLMITLALGFLVLQMMAARVLPYEIWANPIATQLYGSPETAICEIYKDARESRSCPRLAPVEAGGER